MLPMIRKANHLPGLMDNFFGKDFLSTFFNDSADHNMPAVNIKENKDNFEIEVAAPGLEKKDFKIEIDRNNLTVSSVKEFSNEESEEHYTRREFSYQTFSRSFVLPETVNQDKVGASHKNGVLTITLPKKDEAKVKPAKEIKIA